MEMYFRRELPRVVGRRFESVLSESKNPLESQLRSQLVDIVRDAQSEIFRSYRRGSQTLVAPSSPGQENNNYDQHQQALIEDLEPPPPFNFSALYAPQPIIGNYTNPNGTASSDPLLCNFTEQQQTSDLGNVLNNVDFNFNVVEQPGLDAENLHSRAAELGRWDAHLETEELLESPAWWF